MFLMSQGTSVLSNTDSGNKICWNISMRELQPQLNPEDKELMEKLLSAGHIEHKYAVRLQTILLRTKGKGTGEISEFLGIRAHNNFCVKRKIS